jgi:hypothetical protein
MHLRWQVDDTRAAGKPLDETLALYDGVHAAFNEAKGFIRHSISAGVCVSAHARARWHAKLPAAAHSW